MVRACRADELNAGRQAARVEPGGHARALACPPSTTASPSPSSGGRCPCDDRRRPRATGWRRRRGTPGCWVRARRRTGRRARARPRSSAAARRRRRWTSRAVIRSPRSTSHTISGLSCARSVGSACNGASSSAFQPRQTRNASHSSSRSNAGTCSSTTQPSSVRTFAAPRPSSSTPGSVASLPPRSPTQATRRARDVAFERARRTSAGVGHHREQQGDVGDRARHRPHLTELRHRAVRHDRARGRAEAQHVAERRRVAQRAHVVAAVGDRQHPRRQRRGRAAAAAADRAGAVVGVAGDAVDRVVGLRAEAELGRVGLADDDRARRPQPRHEGLVDGAHPVAVDRRSRGPRQVRHLSEVLHRDRQAVQGPALRRTVARCGLVEHLGPVAHPDDRVDLRVERLDAVEVGVHHLDARRSPLPISATSSSAERSGRSFTAARRACRRTGCAGTPPAPSPAGPGGSRTRRRRRAGRARRRSPRAGWAAGGRRSAAPRPRVRAARAPGRR